MELHDRQDEIVWHGKIQDGSMSLHQKESYGNHLC